MKAGDFEVNYDGSSVVASIKVKPSLALKVSLYVLNILLIAVIVLFTIGGIGIIVLFILVFEILFLRYSIWHIHGSETIILKKDSLTYQRFYGMIKLPARTININKALKVIPFHEDFKVGNTAMKLMFESYDDDNEPVNLYQTALVISNADYGVFMKAFNQLYIK